MNIKLFSPLLMTGALLAGAIPSPAHAATKVDALASVANNGNTTSGYPFFWSDNFSTDDDLILGMAPSSSTGAFAPYAGTNATAYNDGGIGPIGSDFSMFSGVGQFGGTELVFDFATPVNISSIEYYGGWQDNGRSSVNFTVSYSTDGGSTYTALIDAAGGTYGYYSGDGGTTLTTETGPFNDGGAATFKATLGGSGPISNYVHVYDDADTYLGANAAITNVKFNFGDVANGWSGLEELVVTGVAVPEPGATGLCISAGLLGLCVASRRRLRRRKA